MRLTSSASFPINNAIKFLLIAALHFIFFTTIAKFLKKSYIENKEREKLYKIINIPICIQGIYEKKWRKGKSLNGKF